MEFRRGVEVRPGVREIERECGLRIGVAVGADTGRRPAERALPIGPDSETRAGRAVVKLDCDARRIARDRQRSLFDTRQFQLRCARRQRRDEMTVLDIETKGVEADLRCRKGNLRRAQKPPRGVDDAQSDERGGVRPASLPTAQCRQRRHRACQQRGGAVIVVGIWRDEDSVYAGSFKRDSTDEARRPAADDRDFSRDVFPDAAQPRGLACSQAP